jgi:hypothetical protein
MRATVGDRRVVKKVQNGEPGRDGEILEVRGSDGGPPFVVRWSDDGSVGMVFPGPDALIEHFPHGVESPSSR